MRRMLVATMNPGKLLEIAAALRPHGIEVVGLETLADRTEVDESGSSFAANARLKAEGYSRRTDLPVLADDSGLEVDALGGAPGVHSARFGGPGLDDAGRTQKLLAEIRDIADPARRGARFRCALAVARGGKTLAVFEGRIEGRLLEAPRGSGGFGYDPIFFHPPSDCSTAELSVEEKQRVSHRGQAIQAFLDALAAGDPRLSELG